MRKEDTYHAGLDIGSTTAKLVLTDEQNELVFSEYARHHARIIETVHGFLTRVSDRYDNPSLKLTLTGSAGMGLAQRLKLPFAQEVICCHDAVMASWPEVRTVVDIGGEDSKMVFFTPGRPPDIRMNGSCAGGTGSFIDQLAVLLKIAPSHLDTLAEKHTRIYPIASRCGVFAKTDVQNLLSRNVSLPDIAASVFHAVAVQCLNTLARGADIRAKVLLCGGVFTFLPQLARLFLDALNLGDQDRVLPPHPEFLPAIGAAISTKFKVPARSVRTILNLLTRDGCDDHGQKHLAPLFRNPEARRSWINRRDTVRIRKEELARYAHDNCFLGIDSGSTTTKIVVTGEDKAVLFSWYSNNDGNPVQAAVRGIRAFYNQVRVLGKSIRVVQAVVTGYGEELIHAAFNMDGWVVETIAHYEAAQDILPDVSFILDIGGQDMKAIFVRDGVLNRIELNEACSSGCGSFIETFARSLGYGVETFAEMALDAQRPSDLGTRCTVFMNSRVKQSLKDNSRVEDISAGLSYSVVKNCLYKVLKLHDTSVLGNRVVLQGGAFKNPSIVRAMEMVLGCPVVCPDMPEMMGALGAALIAGRTYLEEGGQAGRFLSGSRSEGSSFNHQVIRTALDAVENYATTQVRCKRCDHACRVTRFEFPNQRVFFSGNKCENIFSSRAAGPNGESSINGFDFPGFKSTLLFDREPAPHNDPVLTIGIPRCLGIYENYPFWHALFTGCRINIRLSPPSTMGLSDQGMGSIMSDNICFPAKLVHGHVMDLTAGRKLRTGYRTGHSTPDRIFIPMVVYESKTFEQAQNSYNCPIVTAYAEVISSSIQPAERFNIPLDRPVISFHDQDLLVKACVSYLRTLGIPKKTIRSAVHQGLAAQDRFRKEIKAKGEAVINSAARDNRLLFVLGGRPYHVDPLINHKIPQMISRFGVDTITEDAVPDPGTDPLEDTRVITQWAYPNRIYHAARWVAGQGDRVQLVQLNSFGCGPDAVVIDEARQILAAGGKPHTLIKIDDISSTGSVKLRLRSLIQSLKRRASRTLENRPGNVTCRKNTPVFRVKDRKRVILAPFFSEDYSGYLPPMLGAIGYRFRILPRPDRQSVELGLKYASHDICYPGILVIGDVVKALSSGQYDPDRIAVGITQTGGQCRASNYIALIRKAMIDAGFEQIPLISVTNITGLTHQPGFRINWLCQIKLIFMTLIFGDCIAKMYYPTAVREVDPGTAKGLRNRYMKAAGPCIARRDYAGLISLLEEAVDSFNRVDVREVSAPRIGIVGEIYVKYNYFGNQHLADWLIDHGVEPVIPPLLDYFLQDLVNFRENTRAHLRHRRVKDLLGVGIEAWVNQWHHIIHERMRRFRFYTPFHNIRLVSRNASKILSLVNQFGEGWLIPGEIACLAQEGIHHVISVQPFGCIANHVISKGVESRIKSLYPRMNILYIDFDSGTSEVNVQNRLHFIIDMAARVSDPNSPIK
ncbi:MAG: CoA protein activase [Desulfobacteraceae bacterium]|nr:MAG: CoA protein activase [Desulfobacteraceae bacterium]